MPSHSRPLFELHGPPLRRLRRCVIAAAAPQCVWLVVAGGGTWSLRALLALICGLLLLVPFARTGRRLHGSLAMPLVSGSLGGFGMLCGTLLDQYASGHVVPACHAALAHNFWPELNWMNGLMFAACVPGCLWLCPLCGSAYKRAFVHVTAALCMFAGMTLGGLGLVQLAGDWSWARYSGSMHVAMLVGMMLGTLAVQLTLVPRPRPELA